MNARECTTGFRFDSAAARDFFALTKPRLTSLVGVAALSGAVLAGATQEDRWRVFAALIGTWMMGAGGAALNQVMEADADAKMERTRMRPVAAGRMQPRPAAIFGLALASIGFTALAVGTNALTAALGLTSLLSYLLVYTPLKRTTSLCTIVGAVPGALPPVMGWTAVRGEISVGAALLFTILFFWQLPHFLAFAWMKREDYARGGFPMLSVVDPDGGMTARQVLLYGLALLPASLAPTVFGLTGTAYFQIALVLGLGLMVCATGLALERTVAGARRLFLASLVYLPALLVALMADRVMR